MANSDNPSVPDVLPRELAGLYLRTKADTNFVCSFITETYEEVSHHPVSEGDVSVRELRRRCEVLNENKQNVPVSVIETFRRVLQARNAITTWYLQTESCDTGSPSTETESHQFFNDTLTACYELLLPLEHREEKSTAKQAQHLLTASRNFFVVLGDFEVGTGDAIDTGGLDPLQSKDCIELTDTKPATTQHVLKGDPLPEYNLAFNLYTSLTEISDKITGWWAQAGDGKLPIAVAAVLSDVAILNTIRVASLLDVDGTWSHAPGYIEALKHNEGCCHPAFNGALLSDLEDAVAALGDARRILTEGHDSVRACSGKRLYEYFRTPLTEEIRPDSPTSEHSESNQEALRSLLVAILHPKSDGPKLSLPYPAGAYIANHLRHAGSEYPIMSLWLVVLIIRTSKAFAWNDETPNPVNCRLQALRFAQEVVHAQENVHNDPAVPEPIRTVRGRECLSQGQGGIAGDFIRTRQFDIYSQAPLVCGHQIVDLALGMAVQGLVLLNHDGVFGTLLYAYQAARTVVPASAESPSLEAFCDKFQKAIFLTDSFPKSNFCSAWQRFMGASLKKMPERNMRPILDTPGPYPTDRLRPRELSACYDMRCDHFALLDKYAKYAGNSRPGNAAKCGGDDFATIVDFVEGFHPKALEEFSGSAPIAKLDYFSIWLLSLKTLKEISRRAVRSGSNFVEYAMAVAGTENENGVNFVFYFLNLLDEEMAKGTPGPVLQSKSDLSLRAAKLVQEVVGELWGEKTPEEFQWKSL